MGRPAGAEGLLHLVDDRGEAVGARVEVCFQVELRNECASVAPRAAARAPQGFSSVRVEGDDHGPVQLRRADIAAQGDGSYRVTVPRKALLLIQRPVREVAAPAAGPSRDGVALGVSLYLPADASFREPAFRVSLAGPVWQVKIPAGQFIASLTRAGSAPNLRRLVAPPGGSVRLAYRPLPGWSLVVRCRAGAGGGPVAGAGVKLVEALGFGRPARPIASDFSAADGLALVSGIVANLVSVSAEHAGFLPATVHGITAGPGTFALREVALAVGGRLLAHVSVHGRPLSGAGCQIDDVQVAAVDPREAAREVWTGLTDAKGTCVSPRLAAGGYRLRVRVPDSSAVVRRWISLTDGQDQEEDLALVPSRISGTVLRRDQPAIGYKVAASVVPLGEPSGAGLDTAGEATSDENGRYELTLWDAGRYILRLRSPAGGSVAGHHLLTTLGDDDQTVDFSLDASAFTGTVVDEAGLPVPGATVALTYWSGGVTTAVDSAGDFSIDADGSGAATLRAVKTGYAPSDEAQLQVVQDGPIPPVTLVLKRLSTFRGTVTSASGTPLAGVLVTSLRSLAGGEVTVYASATSDGQGIFEVAVPPGTTRAFLDGPACPLSVVDLVAQAAPDPDVDPAAVNLVACVPQPAALDLSFLDNQGRPMPHAVVILRLGGTIVPQRVLATHLTLLGLPPESDGSGRLVLAQLAPGEADLYLKGPALEGSIAAGLAQGFLTSVDLAALETAEVQLTVPGQP